MLISYNWIKDFIKLQHKPQEVADKITLNLVEVETLKKSSDDYIFEIENKGITNRPDCFSQLGLAREIAAYFDLPLFDPIPKLIQKHFLPQKKMNFKVEVKDQILCPRYTSIVLTNIKVKPSPIWLKNRLENSGIRSINNVVDITNFVMLELGQPLHAFDYDKLQGKKIIVRKARKGETIKTLDGVTQHLDDDILVIADSQKAVGIAGLMGGAESEISPSTKTIVLESANFEKFSNRLAEKKLKLRTEASTRFEKGIDINLTLPTLNRVIQLLIKLADAKIASTIVDIQSKKVIPWTISTSIIWINKFLGLSLSVKQITQILTRLGLSHKIDQNNLEITIPTYRSDLTMPADIAEEIARIYGYDNIPITPIKSDNLPPKTNQIFRLTQTTKLWLSQYGYSEILTTPFVEEKILNILKFDPKNHLKLINPLITDRAHLRLSLIPNLLEAAKNNLRFFKTLRIFEIDRIYVPNGQKQPTEKIMLGLVYFGKKAYLHLKGVLENLFNNWGIKPFFKPIEQHELFWQTAKSALIQDGQQRKLGIIGHLDPDILIKLNIDGELAVAEIDINQINTNAKSLKIFFPISEHPPIIEDLTFSLKPRVLIGDIMYYISQISKIIKNIELINTYQNNATFRITYQHPEKNLTNAEITTIRKAIINAVREKGWGILKEKAKD